MKRSEAPLAWLLLLPTLLALGVFVVYPALESARLSLYDFNAFMTKSEFVGLDNYRLLFHSPDYWQSVRVSISFMLMTAVPSVALSLVIAVLLDANPYARGFFRLTFILPVAISSAMAAMLWIFLYNPNSGFLNYALELLGAKQGPNWLGSANWAVAAVAIATVWRELGFNVIFFMAALASIPQDVREAALLDGAKPLQTLLHITLPLIVPTLLFVSVVSVLNAFQSFGQIHILTGGGPAGATNTLVYSLYRDAFQNFQTGSASAQAILLFLLMMIATWFQFRVANKSKTAGARP